MSTTSSTDNRGPGQYWNQRLARQLARALLQVGERIRFVKWNDDLEQLELIGRTKKFEYLSNWRWPSLSNEDISGSPILQSQPVAVETHDPAESNWLVVPEVRYMTFHQRPLTLDVIMAARRRGLKVAFVDL